MLNSTNTSAELIRQKAIIDTISLIAYFISNSPYILFGMLIGGIKVLRDDTSDWKTILYTVFVSGLSAFLGKCLLEMIYTSNSSYNLTILVAGVCAYAGQKGIDIVTEKVFSKLFK